MASENHDTRSVTRVRPSIKLRRRVARFPAAAAPGAGFALVWPLSGARRRVVVKFEAGRAGHVWSVEELVELLEA